VIEAEIQVRQARSRPFSMIWSDGCAPRSKRYRASPTRRRRSPALLDRLLQSAHIVPIAGESYRLRHQRQAGIVQGIRAGKAA
jgi:hypothetical protein